MRSAPTAPSATGAASWSGIRRPGSCSPGSWDASWQYDPALLTEVEVRFTEVGPRQTRVELEHRDLDRFGAARDEVRSALDSEGGWGGLMLAYAQTAEAAHAAQTANA
jgi:hypothetical protein